MPMLRNLKAQRELINAYQKEQLECIQGQINEIRNLVEERQSHIAWQRVNKVGKRKSTSRVKLKAASQEEQIHTWQEHLKNLLGKSPKVTDKPFMKIINNQLDIKLGQFTREELDVVLIQIKNRKAACFDEIPPEVWKTKKFDNRI